MNCRISHPTKNVNCEIQLPSSKSISNRLLIIRSLCKEKFEIKNLSNADDTQILAKALKADKKIIDVKHAGSSFRFLTSFFSLNKGKEYILTGSDRLKKRPIKDLVEILQRMGAKIKYVNKEGFAPLKILGSEIMGGRIEVNGGISSQFITAILLIAPTLDNGIELKIVGNIVSKPYISMTLRVMRDFGIKWTWIDNIITIRKQKYISRNYCVESDWSCASFWFQIASLSKECNIKLNGLKENSLQGDKKTREIFESLGVSSSFEKGKLILTKKKETSLAKEINLIETPDLYQPIKCTLFAKNIDSTLSGIQTLEHKETHRVNAVKKEIEKLNSTKIINTYNDHRMAMSFAPLALKFNMLQINNLEVVSKSYPDFWEDLERGGFIISPLSD